MGIGRLRVAQRGDARLRPRSACRTGCGGRRASSGRPPLGAVEALEESAEASVGRETRARHEAAIFTASDGALEADREEGHKMSLDEAVEHALRASGSGSSGSS